MYIATGMTFLGGLVRCVSTFPGLNDEIDPEVQYWLGVVAQAITGVGNPICASLPTKVRKQAAGFSRMVYLDNKCSL